MAEQSNTVVAPPLVSVYLPTRGRPGLLDRAVRSVLDQTWPAVELIVVIDGPCRESERILEPLAGKAGARLHIHCLPSVQGACAARNAALRLASGAFITGLDDDDYFLPHRVESLINAFDPDRHSLIFSGCMRHRWDGKGRVLEDAVLPGNAKVTLPQLLRANLVGNQMLTTVDRLRGIGGFDESLSAWQDHDCWLRLVMQFGEAQALRDISYVQDQVSASGRISRDMAAIEGAMVRFLEKYSGIGGSAYPAFVRMNRAFYGGDILSLLDVLRIGMEDVSWLEPAIRHYLGGKKSSLLAI